MPYRETEGMANGTFVVDYTECFYAFLPRKHFVSLTQELGVGSTDVVTAYWLGV